MATALAIAAIVCKDEEKAVAKQEKNQVEDYANSGQSLRSVRKEIGPYGLSKQDTASYEARIAEKAKEVKAPVAAHAEKVEAAPEIS